MLRWSWSQYLMVTEISSVGNCAVALEALYTSLDDEYAKRMPRRNPPARAPVQL